MSRRRSWRVGNTGSTKVALELKKFLTKSIEERDKAFRKEAERRAEEIRQAQRARADAEENARLREEENLGLRSKIAELSTDSKTQAESITKLSEGLRQEKLSREHQETERAAEAARHRSQRFSYNKSYFHFRGTTLSWVDHPSNRHGRLLRSRALLRAICFMAKSNESFLFCLHCSGRLRRIALHR